MSNRSVCIKGIGFDGRTGGFAEIEIDGVCVTADEIGNLRAALAEAERYRKDVSSSLVFVSRRCPFSPNHGGCHFPVCEPTCRGRPENALAEAEQKLTSLRPSVAEMERDEAIARAERAEAALAAARDMAKKAILYPGAATVAEAARAFLERAAAGLPSVNWKDGKAYSYCPECGRREPIPEMKMAPKGQ